jgi:hypothetical protein
LNNDPATPHTTPGNKADNPEDYDYWDHVDFIVDEAAKRGLYIAMLPSWGDKWNKKWGQGPEIFTPANAETYGEWLGRRYRDKAIIWVLGGDGRWRMTRIMPLSARWRRDSRKAMKAVI